MIRAVPGGIALTVRVQPSATRSEVAGELGGALKVRLAAPPVDGRANDALVEFLSELLVIPRRSIRITRGLASRTKQVEILGIDPPTAVGRLGLPTAG